VYLNNKTYFSFRYGTFATEELVLAGANIGVQAMAITNINSTCDAWDFVHYCQQNSIKPIVGVEVRNDDEVCYVLLAKNNEGLHDIHLFLSVHLQHKTKFPNRFPENKNVLVVYALQAIDFTIATVQNKYAVVEDKTIEQRFAAKQAQIPTSIAIAPTSIAIADKINIQQLYASEMIGVQLHEVTKLYSLPVQQFANKFMVLHAVTVQNNLYYNAHRLLRAIDKNILLSKQQKIHIAGKHEMFVPPQQIFTAFQNYPNIITNTMQVVDMCNIEMDFDADKNKATYGASAEDDKELLYKLAMDGLQYRYDATNTIAKQRVEKELAIINQLGFNTYFLITWDVIRYAQSRGFFHVGRGSGANSIVAYCLQITDVDPIELNLYFERFLNPYRTSPPDFDLDFSWKDRDQVIDYLFKRYGRHHVTLLGMYSTFQRKAVVRELGKVFGLPKQEIDAMLNKYAPPSPKDSIQLLIQKYGSLLANFPNHQSIHPGGVLISEKNIYAYAVVDMPPKGFGTAQLDMFVAEKVGLYKLDILSQRGLGHIKDAVAFIKQNKKIDIDIHAIEKFKTDEKVRLQIKNADTIGCFYIESPAMRQLLKKLRCDNYITLVAASSIIRPGVSQSGMMREYIQRFHEPNKINYLHPKMKELLQETYGVMVYQEDVIKVAHHFAGLDMGEADILRRAMSGKYRSSKEMDRIREKFFSNCQQRNYTEALAKEVWRQIESFSGYSFSKAHSASFAVESYQSLYLKTYYPIEFMVAVLNNFGGFYSTEMYMHELKKSGATVHAPCVNNSDALMNICGTDVYIGFTFIQGLDDATKNTIIQNRKQFGLYTCLQNFMERTQIIGEHLNTLIRINAFRFTGISKKELLWHANFLHNKHQAKPKQDTTLFATPTLSIDKSILPHLPQHAFDDMIDEMELLGFSLQNPFDIVDDEPNNYTMANTLPQLLGKTVQVLGYLVTTKPVHTVNKEYMCFGTFLDVQGNWVDTVHFPDSHAKYPIQGRGFYKMQGRVVQEFGVVGLEVHQLKKIGIKLRAGKVATVIEHKPWEQGMIVRK
jgi:DNA-directed DNA polymerase III PolC